MDTSRELAEALLKFFDIPGLGAMGSIGAAILAAILGGAWIYLRKILKEAEKDAAREHNRTEPSEAAADAVIENQSASEEWEDAQNDVDDLRNEEGEGTTEQPPEPDEGVNK